MFLRELADLINRHSMESASNTPDYILAMYLEQCLLAFETATQQRETWYGRDSRPSMKSPITEEGDKCCKASGDSGNDT